MLRLLIALVLVAHTAVAQQAAARRGVTVSGVVYDSIGHQPLGGSSVQLVGSSGFASTVNADSLGRYSVESVPPGKYTLGFFHPVIDSLFIAPPLREVVVGDRAVAADISTPSAARLRSVICRSAPGDSGGIVLGAVRSADERAPLAGVSVAGEWLELAIGKGGFTRRMPKLVATTGDNGFYAICNVPRGGNVRISAVRGADSTEAIEVLVPSEGLVRQELSLGARHRERVSGTVARATDHVPLANAQVSVKDGPAARTNERGEFTLNDVPGGTRVLEVRALNYYPQRLPVDVATGLTPTRVELVTLQSVLDTIKVTASRSYMTDVAGFEDRARTGQGRYFSQKDIQRHAVIETSRLFRMVPGVYITTDSGGEEVLQMRSNFAGYGGGPPRCTPRFYVDDHLMPINLFELDGWVKPERIIGIEVYTPGTVPVQFQTAFDECGAIVIWTKRQ